jgi:hypothetical protein
LAFHFENSVKVEEQALDHVLVQKLVVNGNQKLVIMTMEKNIFFCKSVLSQVPLKHSIDLPTGRGGLEMLGMPPMVVSERAVFRIITYMAGMDDDHILPMLRMRTMTVGVNNASNHSMIKGKTSKILGNQKVGVPLVFIGTKGSGG